MRRDFAYGFLAGLLIGWVWLRYAPAPQPPPTDAAAKPKPRKQVIDIFEDIREGTG